MFITLRSKIIAGYAVLVAVHLVFTLWAVNRFSSESSAATGGVGSYASRSTRLLQLSTVTSRLYEETLVVFDDDEERGTPRSRALLQRLLVERPPSGEPGFDSVLQNIEASLEVFDTAAVRYQSTPDPESYEELTEAFGGLVEEIEAAGLYSTRLLAASQEALSESIRNTLATITLASLIAGIIGVLAGVAYARWALQSIERLRTAVRHVSEGEFSQRIHITSADELGDLSFDFNRMIEKLHRYQAMNVESILLERRKAETVVRSIASPIVVVDHDRRILLANSAARRLFPELPTPGDSSAVSGGSIGDERLRSRIYNAVNSEGEEVERFSWEREREGEIRHYTVTLHPLHGSSADDSESATGGGVIVLLTDVTEFKALDAMKSDILARVSHELRTPLSSTLMSVDLLREGVIGELNEQQREMVLAMKTDLKRLSTMIDEILRAARIEALSPPDSLPPVDVIPALEESLRRHRHIAAENGVDLSVNEPVGDPVSVRMLPEHLRLIVDNLLSNAIRFAGEGGRVTFDMETEDQTTMLRVTDDGPGIPLSEQSRVFERFYQVDRGEPDPPGSIGLGLSLVKDIVQRYGGEVSVASREGEGATFTVRLPAKQREEQDG